MIQTIKLLCTTMVIVTAQSTTAGSCELRPECTLQTTCDEDIKHLEWSETSSNVIHLDGTALSVKHVKEKGVVDTIRTTKQTWTISTQGPALLIREPGYSGTIRPLDTTGQIEIGLIQIPREYLDYADALAVRRTYRGICKGPF